MGKGKKIFSKFWKVLLMIFLFVFVGVGVLVSYVLEWNLWFWLVPVIIFFVVGITFLFTFLFREGSILKGADKLRQKLEVKTDEEATFLINEKVKRTKCDMLADSDLLLTFVGAEGREKQPFYIGWVKTYWEGKVFIAIQDAMRREANYLLTQEQYSSIQDLESVKNQVAENPPVFRQTERVRTDPVSGEVVETNKVVEQVTAEEAEEKERLEEEEKKEGL